MENHGRGRPTVKSLVNGLAEFDEFRGEGSLFRATVRLKQLQGSNREAFIANVRGGHLVVTGCTAATFRKLYRGAAPKECHAE